MILWVRKRGWLWQLVDEVGEAIFRLVRNWRSCDPTWAATRHLRSQIWLPVDRWSRRWYIIWAPCVSVRTQLCPSDRDREVIYDSIGASAPSMIPVWCTLQSRPMLPLDFCDRLAWWTEMIPFISPVHKLDSADGEILLAGRERRAQTKI